MGPHIVYHHQGRDWGKMQNQARAKTSISIGVVVNEQSGTSPLPEAVRGARPTPAILLGRHADVSFLLREKTLVGAAQPVESFWISGQSTHYPISWIKEEVAPLKRMAQD
ncbi:hypothetical protein AAFF_G00264410 [Aldrovandia affinis]|uniref:Uncharacterized protein n=1 Tax=Aldrovandia affinis TaxID=143900 RepID=A0AAD7SU41_9TELE|nr:hypothetical protein AAFF_G00264410 [Aldrovandia affinis]